MGKVIGIDLGTTFSAAACVNEHGKPEILPNSESERITPSVILFDEDTVVVGKYARQQMLSDVDRVVAFVKRQMGESVEDYHRAFNGDTYSADALAALILKKVKQDAGACLQDEVTDAVITVPAYFGDAQRAATRNAGEIAGLNVIQLLNEPTAAAIAYGMDKLGQDQKVFVFDLGGGTFDVTVMEVRDSKIRMIQTNGNHQLGGKDWDDAIFLHVARRFEEQHGVNPVEDPQVAQELQLRATEAKEILSHRPKTRIACGSGTKTTVVELTREEFEKLTEEKLEACRELCELVLRDAKLAWTDIDTVLLVGGSTRMPMVRNMLSRLTGKRIDSAAINPDEAVALGAAIQATLSRIRDEPEAAGPMAAVLAERYGSSDIQIIDGATHSLGVIADRKDGVSAHFVMIEKMQPVPCEKTDDGFRTKFPGQRQVLVRVVQGLADGMTEETGLDFNDYKISELVLPLPPGLAAGSPIALTYKYGRDQTLEVSVRGPDGRVVEATINRTSLDQEAVHRAALQLQRMSVE